MCAPLRELPFSVIFFSVQYDEAESAYRAFYMEKETNFHTQSHELLRALTQTIAIRVDKHKMMTIKLAIVLTTCPTLLFFFLLHYILPIHIIQ